MRNGRIGFCKKLVEQGSTVLFPTFYQFAPGKLPKELCWIHNVIYNEVQSDSGSRHVAYQIVERVFHDDLWTLLYKSLEILLQDQYFENEYIMRSLRGRIFGQMRFTPNIAALVACRSDWNNDFTKIFCNLILLPHP